MTVSAAPSPTRTAPARAPDGFWLGHPRYRRYVLFAGTGLVLAVDALLLLEAVGALAGGPEAWAALLESSRSATGLGAGLFLLLGTLFFSVRWLRVGVKVPTVRIGVIPEPPAPLVYFAHFGALALCTALVLLVLGGVIL